MLENNIGKLSQQFSQIVEALSLSLKGADESTESNNTLKIIDALRQNIQIMVRLDSDVKNNNPLNLSVDEVSEVGDYALNLLDEISVSCASKGLQEQMLQLHRLSLPIVYWLHQYKGKLSKLDIVVNAIASYANTLQDKQQLELLCDAVTKVVEITDPVIKQDLEATNPMRPWRILNLNWGIVATRTYNPEIMEAVFSQLQNNIPVDAASFFKEGMQQMDIVGYPDEVRVVMKKFADGLGAASVLH